MPEIISKYIWAILIAATVINYSLSKMRTSSKTKANPELAEVYSSLQRGYLIWGNLPSLPAMESEAKASRPRQP